MKVKLIKNAYYFLIKSISNIFEIFFLFLKYLFEHKSLKNILFLCKITLINEIKKIIKKLKYI